MHPILLRRLGIAALVAALAVTISTCSPALLGGTAIQPVAASGATDGTVALFVSGDAGVRFGMGRPITFGLAATGVPVLAISSPAAFAATRTRGEVDAVVADGVRRALAQPGARRLILIGQSFGSDMLSVAVPDLPAEMRARIAALVLVVPGDSAYFHPDPLGLAYRRAPDARPAAGMRTVDWTPVICIRGATETDSLCPLLDPARVQQVVLPGGHFLRRDDALLVRTILARLAPIRAGDR